MDRGQRIRDAQTVVRASRDTVEQMTENGARVRFTPGVVVSHAGAYEAEIILGAGAYATPYVTTDAGQYLAAGAYVVVGQLDSQAWVDRVLPFDMYTRMALDHSNGRIYFGNGTVAPSSVGSAGQALLSGGPSASAYWGTAVGGSSPPPDGDKGDITVSGTGTVWTVDPDVVTFAKMQNISTDRLIGRDSASSGDPEEISLSTNLEWTGSGGIRVVTSPTFTDVDVATLDASGVITAGAGTSTLGSLSTGTGVSTGTAFIELGGLRSGDGSALVDFHATSGTDFEARITRQSGTNGNFLIRNDGTGDLIVQTNGANAAITVDSAQQVNIGDLDATGLLYKTGIISPAQITGNTNNWNPTGLSTCNVIRVDVDAARTITGIVAQSSGREIKLVNITAFTITLTHDASSTLANRFLCPGAANFSLVQQATCTIWYDGTSSRWRVQG